MEHFYLNKSFNENWFTYKDLYAFFAEKISNNGLFVEIGSWTGRSSVYLAVEIINLNKKVRVDCVDIWPDDVYSLNISNYVSFNYKNKKLYDIFLKNIEPVKHIINPIRMLSSKACDLYEDNSIDILFIDGNHDYDFVKNDILKWLPKVKNGGIISGHDYHNNWPGVVKAVNEIFKGKVIKPNNDCWMVNL